MNDNLSRQAELCFLEAVYQELLYVTLLEEEEEEDSKMYSYCVCKVLVKMLVVK